MIAQTWSEHCKHKIFNATIRYREAGREEVIRSLFRTYIRATTEALRKRQRFLRSVFHDNSGVIAFDRSTLVCFKVETHNSPSALDPYGGAITGIVGVNRDILGTGMGARPIFNTDVLCFGYPADSGFPGAGRASCTRGGSWKGCTAASWTAATSRVSPSLPGVFSSTTASSASRLSSAAPAGSSRPGSAAGRGG